MKPMTILITKAGSGFGRAAAEALSDAGHRVFAAMGDPSGRDREWANALWAQSIEVILLDMSNGASAERGVREILAKAGSIDVWVDGDRSDPEAGNVAVDPPALNVRQVDRAGRVIVDALKQGGSGLMVSFARAPGDAAAESSTWPAEGAAVTGMQGEIAASGLRQVFLHAHAISGLAKKGTSGTMTGAGALSIPRGPIRTRWRPRFAQSSARCRIEPGARSSDPMPGIPEALPR